jgi:hypothetical protein
MAVVAACIIPAASGCGGDEGLGSDPLEGVYQWISHEERTPCDGQWEPMDEFGRPQTDYFKLMVGQFLTAVLLEYHDCPDATGEGCDESISLSYSFFEKDGQWTSAITSCWYIEPEGCQVEHATGTPEETADGIQLLKTRSSGVAAGVTLEQCVGENALDAEDLVAKAEMSCESQERHRAERVE